MAFKDLLDVLDRDLTVELYICNNGVEFSTAMFVGKWKRQKSYLNMPIKEVSPCSDFRVKVAVY